MQCTYIDTNLKKIDDVEEKKSTSNFFTSQAGPKN